MGRFTDWEHQFRCFREEIGAMLDFNFTGCWRQAPVSRVRQLTEMLVLYARYGFLPESYYNYRFYEGPGPLKQRIKGFVSDKERYRKLGTINDNYRDVLRNKWLFHKLYSLHDIPTPEYYGNYHRHRGSWQDGAPLRCREDIETGIQLQKHKSLVAKPVVGSGGSRVVVFTDATAKPTLALKDAAGKQWTAQELAEFIGQRDYIFESRIEQHPALAAIYPHSLNTVRIVTLNDGHEVRPWAAALRVGTKHSGYVDNWGQGGISIAVDTKSGQLGRGAVSVKHLGSLPRFITEHPDTDYEFTGRTLPNWEDILTTVERAAKVVPGLPYVAWDVAITEAGSAIIEGNHRPDVNLLQVHGGLMQDETYSHWWQEQFAR